MVCLGSMRLSDRPCEAAAALACLSAIQQHTASRPLGLQQHPQQQQGGGATQRASPPAKSQLHADMGRACDGASVSVLLDLVVDAAVEDGPSSRCKSGRPDGCVSVALGIRIRGSKARVKRLNKHTTPTVTIAFISCIQNTGCKAN